MQLACLVMLEICHLESKTTGRIDLLIHHQMNEYQLVLPVLYTRGTSVLAQT
jgi:hypothetical protein